MVNFVNIVQYCGFRIVKHVKIKLTKEGYVVGKKTEMVGFKTTPEVKEALLSIAKKEDRSVSYIINRILLQHFGLQGKSDED